MGIDFRLYRCYGCLVSPSKPFENFISEIIEDLVYPETPEPNPTPRDVILHESEYGENPFFILASEIPEKLLKNVGRYPLVLPPTKPVGFPAFQPGGISEEIWVISQENYRQPFIMCTDQVDERRGFVEFGTRSIEDVLESTFRHIAMTAKLDQGKQVKLWNFLNTENVMTGQWMCFFLRVIPMCTRLSGTPNKILNKEIQHVSPSIARSPPSKKM